MDVERGGMGGNGVARCCRTLTLLELLSCFSLFLVCLWNGVQCTPASSECGCVLFVHLRERLCVRTFVCVRANMMASFLRGWSTRARTSRLRGDVARTFVFVARLYVYEICTPATEMAAQDN